MNETLEKIAQIGKTPLAQDAPEPKQFRDESREFELLEQEISKLSSLNAAPVDWREVVNISTVILRDKSKDLEVASYLCRGLLERDGYAGLCVGFTILRDIIQEHWDIAYPPKKKARMRGGKISWLVDRIGKLLPNYEPEDKDAIISCADIIKEIESLLNDKLGDHAPILRGLREPLQSYKQNFIYLEEQKKPAAQKAKEEPDTRKAKEVKKPVEDSKPDEAKPETQQVVVPQPAPKLDIPSLPQSVASANEIKKAFRSCHGTLYQIAAVKRAEKLYDPLPYHILRFSAWMSIEKMPFLQNGKFVAPGPSKNQIGECVSLLEQGQHALLIETVESLFANPDVPANAYWLDAHRFTAMALETLGPQYNQAKQAVIDELSTFLRRFPGIQELSFNDNTPFSDAQTKLWIQEQVLISQQEQTTSSSESAASIPA